MGIDHRAKVGERWWSERSGRGAAGGPGGWSVGHGRVSILPAMPPRPNAPRHEAELVELRVLDGPNRFSTRPAVKLDLAGSDPGRAEEVAWRVGEAVRELHSELGMPAPRLIHRASRDGLRATLAYPWRRRTISQSIGAAAARVALGQGTFKREAAALRAVALGPLPAVTAPRVPVVAVTGTNGKSTTTRLIAHIAAAAGFVVGMTNSDGIYVGGTLVEAGDWTGFGGAARVLAEPSVGLAVLETARGGILLRGIGYAHNQVAVVTNVSADHLGLQGIDTLDELADVKAAIVRITRRDGWAVLNADDARVWRMRRETRAGWYAFSLDAASPAVDSALDHGGRAAVLSEGWLVLLRPGRHPARVAAAAELPVTFGGLSRYNVANALAAAAACDGLGMDPAVIATGLRTFALDTATNPGRLNLFERRGVLALVDFAHNEAGLAGLLEVCRALAARRGGSVRLALGTAGDRTDEILHRLGELAGAGADEVVIAEKERYLRGRDLAAMNAIFRAGIAAGGYPREVPAYPTERQALARLLARSSPGDVAAVMSHAERAEIFAWLRAEGYRAVGTRRLSVLLGR
jgi:cyanophycin synthetase